MMTKYKKKYFIIIGLILIVDSCKSTRLENKLKVIKSNKRQIIIGEIDTLSVISRLGINEKMTNLTLTSENIANLSENIDTLELTYFFSFCDCQMWIITDIHHQAKDKNSDLDELDPRGQIEFNLDIHGYYIEPASEDLKINWRTKVNGTTIRFIGREYTDKRLPIDGEFTVPEPPKGKVFRYYGYEIIKPYKIWGPKKFIEVDKETGDSLTTTTILTVK